MNKVMRYDCTNGKAQHCYGCYQMTETTEGEWVQAMDYDAAQSELAALREELDKAKREIVVLAELDSETLNLVEKRLKVAEQRNARYERALRQLLNDDDGLRVSAELTTGFVWYALQRHAESIDAALAQPAESGASDLRAVLA